MLAENPLHFGIQTLRRLPPRWRDKLGRGPKTPPIAQALWQFGADRQERARAALTKVKSDSKLGNELRLNLRVPIAQGTPAQMARQDWEEGDAFAGELPGLPGTTKRRLLGELRLLERNQVLEVPLAKRRVVARPSSSTSVLHFLTNSLPWTNSGYSLRSQAILQAQRARGLNVQAATRLAYPVTIGKPQAAEHQVVDGIPYTRLLPTRLPLAADQKLALQTKMLYDIAADIAPSVLHTTTNFTNALSVGAVADALDIPWVYEMRGEMEKTWLARQPEAARGAASQSTRFAMMRARETQMALRADAVVTLSQIQAQSMIERGVDAHKIIVVPNATDSRLLEQKRDRHLARANLGLPDDAFWVGTVSALVGYEGIDDLLRAVALSDSNLRCLIVGDGVQRSDLIQLSNDLGIADRVVFPGKVDPAEVAQWYQALDVMVIPRKETEVTRAVTPIKGLNAMALGIPQIVSDLPALAEVGAADGQGVTTPAEDPQSLAETIRQLENDSDLMAQLSQNARQVALGRTWESAAEKYQALYRRLS